MTPGPERGERLSRGRARSSDCLLVTLNGLAGVTEVPD